MISAWVFSLFFHQYFLSVFKAVSLTLESVAMVADSFAEAFVEALCCGPLIIPDVFQISLDRLDEYKRQREDMTTTVSDMIR